MTRTMIRVPPNKDQEKNSPPKSQNLLKEPSHELCRFTDPEIDQMHSHFPPGTIFRPFDSTMKSDCMSATWVCFHAAPFQVGFSYPFPAFTQSLFTFTGLCYSQAMPMLWRVLYTLEHIIAKESIDLGLTKLNHLYNLVSHGSYRYLFKAKPQHPHPLLKVTKNDTNWKNQFFFVRRDSIPNGNHLPKKWNLKAASLSSLTDRPATPERVAAFWDLDSSIGTYQPRIKDSEEASSTSYTMSSAAKSSKSTSKFGVSDIQGIVSPKSIKKELAAGQSIPEVKGVSTRTKAGSKRKKPSELTGDLPLIEQQLHEAVSKVRIT
ncbi:hypothetical protein HanIR_Chr16g0799481 [Helianthus annuus]|nr:hypothetical protein HanIR_Chr16g0799481 [Helianthus annuus]